MNRRSHFQTVLPLTSSTYNCLTEWSWFKFFGGDLFSDVSRCPGTFIFLSSSLGRPFHFGGTAPFLKVHRLPPATRKILSVRKWTLQTTVALVKRKQSFSYFFATPFSRIRRSFSAFGDVKNLKCDFFPCRIVDFIWATEKRALFSLLLFLLACLPPSWNTINLKLRFHSNRKSELCKASILSLSLYFLWSTSGIRSWTPAVFAYINDLPNTSNFLFSTYLMLTVRVKTLMILKLS